MEPPNLLEVIHCLVVRVIPSNQLYRRHRQEVGFLGVVGLVLLVALCLEVRVLLLHRSLKEEVFLGVEILQQLDSHKEEDCLEVVILQQLDNLKEEDYLEELEPHKEVAYLEALPSQPLLLLEVNNLKVVFSNNLTEDVFPDYRSKIKFKTNYKLNKI